MGKKEKEDAKGFSDFISKMSRRDFLRIAAAAAIGGAAVINELLKERGQKEEETTIEKTTPEIEKEFDIEKASGIELFEKLSEYPEAIEKSKKQSLDKFAEDLPKFDNLILGINRDESEITEGTAAHFLEQLLKNNREISAIGLKNLSYTSPEHVQATKLFNQGKLSAGDVYKESGASLPLLELARKHSIEIVGLESEILGDTSRITAHKELPRRVGEVAKKKKERGEKGIVVTYIFQGNATVDSWENEKLLYELAGEKVPHPPKEEALKNNYTVKEYLEKIGLNPVAIQIEDWKVLTKSFDKALSLGFSAVPPEDLKLEDIEKAKKIWEKFILKEKEPFVVKYPKGKDNTFAMIIPDRAPQAPEFPRYFLPKK